MHSGYFSEIDSLELLMSPFPQGLNGEKKFDKPLVNKEVLKVIKKGEACFR